MAASQAKEIFYRQIGEIAGVENVLSGEKATVHYTVDGICPQAVVFPTSTEQVADIIRAANESNVFLVPWGGGSKQGIGPCLKAAETVLCLKNMNRVEELEVSNFTAQVQAGIINHALQKQLAEQNLFFPLDPLYTESSTIGGEIAANANGPRRIMYGTVRDLVLGVTVVTPNGDVVHTGGKTMKNVAGIDLCRMYIGSWGTLGVITEAVLRLFPLSEVSAGIYITFSSPEDAFRLVGQLLKSPLTPSAIELTDHIAGGDLAKGIGSSLNDSELLLIINAEGTKDDVARHCKDVFSLAEANKAKKTIALKDEAASDVWNTYRGIHRSMLAASPSAFHGRASVPISKMGDMLQQIKRTGADQGVDIGMTAHCGNGILYTYLNGDDERLARVTGEMKQAAAKLGGFFIVAEAPLSFRKKGDILPPRDDYPMMRHLKTTFDPNDILNPGRLIGGTG